MNKPSLSEIHERDDKKKELFVYATAKRDIILCKRYLDKLKENKNDIYEREANVLSLHIIYGRIFSKNNILPKLNIEKLKCELTKNEAAMHKNMMNLRNKIFAHSDAVMNNIQINHDVNTGKLVATPSFNTDFIDENNYEIAIQLFNKLETTLDEKIEPLLNELYSQLNNYQVNSKNYVLLGYSNNFWEKYETK